MVTAFERTLERVKNGETITVAVAAEYKSWRSYYEKSTKQQREQISAARKLYQYNKPGKPLVIKQKEAVDSVRLLMPVSRKERIQQQALKKGISVNKYINSLIVADLVE
ncbi:MAG: hypothetical protein ACO1O2_25635 [Larkinella arboricola]